MSGNPGFTPRKIFTNQPQAMHIGFKETHLTKYIEDHIINGDGQKDAAVKRYDEMDLNERRAFISGINLGFKIDEAFENNDSKPLERYKEVLLSSTAFPFFSPYCSKKTSIRRQSKNSVS